MADHPGYQRRFVSDLDARKPISNFEVAFEPQIVISGKILDPDGDPLPQVQVRAARMVYLNGRRQFSPAATTVTDSNGEYMLQTLGAGKYYLSATTPGNHYSGESARSAAASAAPGQPPKQEEAAVLTFYPGVTDLLTAQPLELVKGHDLAGTDLTLRKVPVFHIRGSVTGDIPTNRAQLQVTVMPRASYTFDPSGSVSRVGKAGTFDLAYVPAGSYTVALAQAASTYKPIAMIPVEVANRDVENLVLTVETPVDLPGVFIVEKNGIEKPTDSSKPSSPGSPLRVNLQSLDGPTFMNPIAAAREDGSFTIPNVTPGSYRVFGYSLAAGMYVKAVRFADRDVMADGLKLSPGTGSMRLEITVAVDGSALDGIVRDAEGKPADSKIVTLAPDPPVPSRLDLYKQSSSDKDGKFTIKGIAPGKYRIYAWEHLEFGSQWDPEFLKIHETEGTKLEFAKSDSQQVTITYIK